MVLPQQISPLPWYYHALGPRPRGATVKLAPIPSRPHRLCPRPHRSVPIPLFLSPFPSPSFKISLTQWVTLSFSVQKNHPLAFSNSRIMFTWHICYTSNSTSSQFTVQYMITLKIRRPTLWYYRNKSPRSHGITMHLVPVPAVLPWSWSPSPWCYCELSPLLRSNCGYCGKTVIPIPVQLSKK